MNNPLKYVDSTGESFWKKVGKWFKNSAKTIAGVIATHGEFAFVGYVDFHSGDWQVFIGGKSWGTITFGQKDGEWNVFFKTIVKLDEKNQDTNDIPSEGSGEETNESLVTNSDEIKQDNDSLTTSDPHVYFEIFNNKADAYNYAVELSNGILTLEVSGYKLETGDYIVFDPVLMQNSSHSSHNPSITINGSSHRYFKVLGYNYEIIGHFHTHPATYKNTTSPSPADLHFLNSIGLNKTSILYKGQEWIVSKGGSSYKYYTDKKTNNRYKYNYSLSNLGKW